MISPNRKLKICLSDVSRWTAMFRTDRDPNFQTEDISSDMQFGTG